MLTIYKYIIQRNGAEWLEAMMMIHFFKSLAGFSKKDIYKCPFSKKKF